MVLLRKGGPYNRSTRYQYECNRLDISLRQARQKINSTNEKRPNAGAAGDALMPGNYCSDIPVGDTFLKLSGGLGSYHLVQVSDI
jgi:hypothetical protein